MPKKKEAASAASSVIIRGELLHFLKIYILHIISFFGAFG
ncbi:hypothetical protein SAMN06265375_104102 [Muriicola jejuensis]|nr:hypothetical protein SAMN06265375_104102 [Muriicola jejuensis]